MGLHFSKEEFSNRKEKTLNSMKNEGVDALIMFRQESMYWLTGYDTFGYVFFQALVLDQKGNVILLTRAPDLRQAQNTSNISDIRIWVDKDGANPADDLKIILDELNLKGKKIGVEYEAYGLTGRNALRLNTVLQNYCSIEDKSELITKLRVIKSNKSRDRVIRSNRNRVVVSKPIRPKKRVVRPNYIKRGFFWIEGYWKWSLFYGKYIWVEGRWERERPGYFWVPGYWEITPGGFYWVEGYWGY